MGRGEKLGERGIRVSWSCVADEFCVVVEIDVTARDEEGGSKCMGC